MWKGIEEHKWEKNGLDTACKSHLVLYIRCTNKFVPPAVDVHQTTEIYCVVCFVLKILLVSVYDGQ